MVKTLRLAAFLLLCLPATLPAQTLIDSLPTHSVKVNLFAWFHPTLSYELHLHGRHSFEATVGGAPQMNHGPYPVGIGYGTLGYRFYALQWSKANTVFFAQASAGMLFTGGRYEVFDSNNGWDIRTRTYHYSNHLFVPVIGLGWRFGKPGNRFFLELTNGYPLGNAWHEQKHEPLLEEGKRTFLVNHIFSFRLGIAF